MNASTRGADHATEPAGGDHSHRTMPNVVLPQGVVGHTSSEAARRLASEGPNRIVPQARRAWVKRLLGPLADPMVALLLIAAPTYLLIGETTDAVVAFVALGPIIAVGWLLESRAQRTLEELSRLTAPVALAWRDGDLGPVRAEELVVGDVVLVQEGDVVPADGRIVDLTQLTVDEAALTGESLPAAKVDGTGDDSMVWAGTTVLSGRAVVLVIATGRATRYGRIGELVASIRQPPTPLQRALLRLVRALTAVAAVFCVAVMAAELLRGNGWGEAVIAGVSLAIAAIPEEFSMIYTLYLALGAWRLAQQRALVRRLPSVETLGSTTVICADKTGTLTHGRLDVARLWTDGGQPGADGGSTSADVALLEAAVYACEPEPFDPLDVAILDFAVAQGIDVSALHRGRLVADWPFDPVDAYLTHVWHDAAGACRIVAKGSTEGILRHVVIDPHEREMVLAANDILADLGMRVIAVAARVADAPSGDRYRDEAGLRIVGLIGFSDPVREGVAEALGDCRNAGIRVIMITGDHPATAHAVAEGLGLPHRGADGDLIVTGRDLDEADAAEVDRLVARANVFARTRPEQKYLLVQELRRRGEVVAMTGDGINDAPALREADIGVAMAQRGTEVAREAASLVLLDDNFATIVGAVRDGRRIFDNLTRAFAYLIAFHPPLLLGALLVPLLGRPLLLLPVHLVLLELVLHPVVSLVFQADPADADVMERPPRSVGEALRLRSLWRPFAVGTVLALGIVSTYLVALHAGWPVGQARTLGFATLLASQPFLLLSTRSPDRAWWSGGRPFTATLRWVVLVIGVLLVAVVYLPPLAQVARLEPFPPQWWTVVVALAAATTTWSEPFKAIGRDPA